MTDSDYDKQKGWLYCIFPDKKYTLSYGINKTYCGIYLRKEFFLNKILNDNKFFPNIVLQELETIKQERKKKRKKEQERYRNELKKQKQIKYENDKIWHDAIRDVKIALEKNSLDLVKLFATDDGKITDYQKEKIYNNMDAMALSIKSYEDFYQGNAYTKNEVLLLINSDNTFITGTIFMPSYLLEEELYGSYNFYIRKLDVIPYYSKYKIFFSDIERIYSTKETRKNLDFILENFANKK